MKTGISVVLQDASGSAKTAGGVDGGYCRRRAADDFLCSVGRLLHLSASVQLERQTDTAWVTLLSVMER